MAEERRVRLIELDSLLWPTSLQIHSRRFRLFIAADVTGVEVGVISDFAENALRNGMVYFCAWGQDCERFHDIVDEVAVADDLGERLFVGPTPGDIVMTTWHGNESLEEALEFFLNFAVPTNGFAPESEYWLAFCDKNPAWAEIIRKRLASS